MKKVLALLWAGIVASATLFAFNFEFDVNYQAVPFRKHRVKEVSGFPYTTFVQYNGNASVSDNSFIGMSENLNFYFGTAKYVDIGLTLGSGFEYISDVFVQIGNYKHAVRKDIIEPRKKSGDNLTLLNFGGFLKIGPIVRINLHKNHSLVFSPSAILALEVFNVIQTTSTDPRVEVANATVGLDLGLTYKLYFVTKDVFNFGLNIGANFLPVMYALHGNVFDPKADFYWKGYGMGVKAHAGLSFNFGRKKYRGQELSN